MKFSNQLHTLAIVKTMPFLHFETGRDSGRSKPCSVLAIATIHSCNEGFVKQVSCVQQVLNSELHTIEVGLILTEVKINTKNYWK